MLFIEKMKLVVSSVGLNVNSFFPGVVNGHMYGLSYVPQIHMLKS